VTTGLWPALGAATMLLLRFAATPAAAESPRGSCRDCQLQLGIGGTYHLGGSTGGVVLPVTLTWDQGRYELGWFRMTTGQFLFDSRHQSEIEAAKPYWAVSASRRWQLKRWRYGRVFFGFGASYKDASDGLNATHWNFAEQLGLQITPRRTTSVELVVRHWSNAGLRLPNRGQDFVTLTYSIVPGR
jgi:hypothetical protein